MAARDGVTFHGLKRIDRGLAKLAGRTATELQGIIVRQMLEAKKRIRATATMSPGAKRSLAHVIKVNPRKRKSPRRLRDVEGELFTTWRGGENLSKEEAASRVIETQVGAKVYRPKRKKGLLIPAGVLLTKTGKVKRKGRKPIDPAEIPDTRFVKTRRGVLLVREKATKTGKKRRTEIVGSLVQQAKPTARLAFFKSWDDLDGKRSRQYGTMLERLLARF